MIGVGVALGLRGQWSGAGGPGGGPNPSPALFPSGAAGALYDPAAPGTLFQDVAGTVPVTADGQPVARMNDTSGNAHHATNPNAATRPLYRTDGTLHWLEFRSTGLDYLGFDPVAVYGTAPTLTMIGAMALTANGVYPIFLGNNDLNTGIFFGLGHGADRTLRLTVANPAIAPLVRAPTAFAIDQPYVVGHTVTPTAHSGWVDGVKVGEAAWTSGWALAAEGRIGFTASVIRSPMKFFGAAIVRRALTDAESDLIGQAMQARSGAAPYTPLVPPLASTRAYAVGDSTIAAYSGQPSVSSLTGTPRVRVDVAVPGHTIAQQKTAWNALTVDPALVGWVVVQVGLNDMNPAVGTTAGKIAELQDLIATIRTGVGPAAPILVAKMLPCRQRWITLYGATNGLVAQQRWVDVNEAVAGNGPTPITGVQGRIVAHVPLLDDGAGNLAAAYGTGDGIHPNTAGRQIMANAWAAALQAAGVTL